MDIYPSPDGTRLLVVRHLWQSAPACSSDPAARYGLDRLSLIGQSGEIALLDVLANAPGPIYLDRFRYEPPSQGARSRIEGVWWSPDNTKAALQIRYADLSNPALPVFTYKVMVYDLVSGTAADLGDGLHPSWDLTGERVQWFRRISPADRPIRRGSFIQRETRRQRFTRHSAPGAQYVCRFAGSGCAALE